jgi:hypothetical protein
MFNNRVLTTNQLRDLMRQMLDNVERQRFTLYVKSTIDPENIAIKDALAQADAEQARLEAEFAGVLNASTNTGTGADRT